jgi:hypothetical protein
VKYLDAELYEREEASVPRAWARPIIIPGGQIGSKPGFPPEFASPPIEGAMF